LRESNEVSARAISAGGRPYHVEKEVTLISSERLAIIVLLCERVIQIPPLMAKPL